MKMEGNMIIGVETTKQSSKKPLMIKITGYFIRLKDRKNKVKIK